VLHPQWVCMRIGWCLGGVSITRVRGTLGRGGWFGAQKMWKEWHLCTEGGRVVVGVSMPWEQGVERAGLGHRDGTVR
jgi:hypothetical protein